MLSCWHCCTGTPPPWHSAHRLSTHAHQSQLRARRTRCSNRHELGDPGCTSCIIACDNQEPAGHHRGASGEVARTHWHGCWCSERVCVPPLPPLHSGEFACATRNQCAAAQAGLGSARPASLLACRGRRSLLGDSKGLASERRVAVLLHLCVKAVDVDVHNDARGVRRHCRLCNGR